jgi:large subunit ribosomal protein L4
MKILKVDLEKQANTTVEADSSVFDTPYRSEVIYQIVRWHRANARRSTQHVKTLAEVSGSTKKMHAQKETGKSRQGDGRECHLRGGGHAHGITPRSYRFKLNKKVRKLAMRVALSERTRNQSLMCSSAISTDGKTSSLVQLLDKMSKLSKLDFANKKILIVGSLDDKTVKSASNLPNVSVYCHDSINTLALIHHDITIIEEPSMKLLTERTTCV